MPTNKIVNNDRHDSSSSSLLMTPEAFAKKKKRRESKRYTIKAAVPADLRKARSERHLTQKAAVSEKRTKLDHDRRTTQIISHVKFYDYGKDPETDYSLSYPCPFDISKRGMIYKVKCLLPRPPPLFFSQCLTYGDSISVNFQFYLGYVAIGLMRCSHCGDCPIYGDIAEPRTKITPRRLTDDKNLRQSCMYVGPSSVWNSRGGLKRDPKSGNWVNRDDFEDIAFDRERDEFHDRILEINGGEVPEDDEDDEDEWMYTATLNVRVNVMALPQEDLGRSVARDSTPLCSTRSLERNDGVFRVSVLSGRTYTLPIPQGWFKPREKTDAHASAMSSAAIVMDDDDFDSDSSSDVDECTGAHLFVLPCPPDMVYGPPIKITVL